MSRTFETELPPTLEPAPINGHADYDALAELFLGDDRPASRAVGPRAGSPQPRQVTDVEPVVGPRPIEALVLGHLPVLASAWVQQYARLLSSERGGPVGLIRLRAGEAQVDLVGSRSEPGHLCGSLEEAIHEASDEVAAWLIRVDETTEPRLPELKGLSAVTLLTGADEAAVVSAYRTLKNLVRPSEDAEGPELRITIMGAAPDKAAEATSKLERAAAAFIGRPIRVAHCIARIGGKASAVLFRGPWAGSIDQVIQMAAAARPSQPAGAPRSPVLQAPELAFGPKPRSIPHPVAPEPVVSRLGCLHQGSSKAASVVCGPLANQITGLRGVEISCPYATGVEFAVDDRGVMHVLGRMESTDLAGLMTAAAWVRSHHSLLRMALSPHIAGFEGMEPSVLHLFTDDARRVRPLGDSPVRLHLLARVEAGGNATWFCTPLN